MDVGARRNLGAHYTSEENILKLIQPLFLDELWAEFEKVKRHTNKLFEFHKKLRSPAFFDPACGCGNFLVIAEVYPITLSDIQPGSFIGTAALPQADVTAAPSGRTLKLKYKDGEKTLVVPSDAPVVTFRPGDRSLLVPGASVSLSAQVIDGRPTALRINAGPNGFALPY